MNFDELYEILFNNENGTYRAVCANNRVEKTTLDNLEKLKSCSYKEGISILKKVLQRLKEDKKSKVMPEVYRKAIFFLTCKLCDELGYEGAQKKILKELNLSHNTFSKFNMTPVEYYIGLKFDITKAPSLGLSRFGKKNEDLCRTFVDLSSQVHYTNFVDVFGGLGTIIAKKPKRSKEFINDFDNSVYKFLTVMKKYPELLIRWEQKVLDDIFQKSDDERIDYAKSIFKKFEKLIDDCNSSINIMNTLRIIYNKINNMKNGEVEKKVNGDFKDLTKYKYISDIYNLYLKEKGKMSILNYLADYISNAKEDNVPVRRLKEHFDEFIRDVNNVFSNPAKREKIYYSNGFYDELFAGGVSVDYKNKKTEAGYYSEIYELEEESRSTFENLIDIAGAFYFINSFNINGKSSSSGITINTLNTMRDNLKRIDKYSERFKDVTILHQDFRDVITSFNDKSTLLYLDSPYIDTEGYNVSFEDREFHDMLALLNEFEGKWIFSCRSSFDKYYNLYQDEPNITKAEEFGDKLSRLTSFFNMFRGRGYYAVEIPIGKTADGLGDKEIMITNFKFIHKDIRKFDELFNKYAQYADEL